MRKFLTLTIFIVSFSILPINGYALPSISRGILSSLNKSLLFLDPTLQTIQLYVMGKYKDQLPTASTTNDTFVRKTLKNADFPTSYIENIAIKEHEMPIFFANGHSFIVPQDCSSYRGLWRLLYPRQNDDSQYLIIKQGIKSYNNYNQKKLCASWGLALSIHSFGSCLKELIPSLATSKLRLLSLPIKLATYCLNQLLYGKWETDKITEEVVERVKERGVLERALDYETSRTACLNNEAILKLQKSLSNL